MGRFAFIAMLIAVIACLVGCDVPTPPPSPIDLTAFERYDIGSAAEMRAWQLRDGSCWCVIGRSDSFVVYRKVGGEWQPSTASRTIADLACPKPPAEAKP